MSSNFGPPSSDHVVNNAFDRVSAMESQKKKESFWVLALQNCKRFAGWRLILAILQGSSVSFRKAVPWHLLLDQLMYVFDEMSFQMKETPPMIAEFLCALRYQEVMVHLMSIPDEQSIYVGLVKFARAVNAHISRDRMLLEPVTHIYAGMLTKSTRISRNVCDWIRRQVKEECPCLSSALQISLRTRQSADLRSFSSTMARYLVDICFSDDPVTEVAMLAKCVSVIDRHWEQQVVVANAIAPLFQAEEEKMVLRGVVLLRELVNFPIPGEKHHKWKKRFTRMYQQLANFFHCEHFNVRMQCVVNAHELGMAGMLEVRLLKEKSSKIQLNIVEMIAKHGCVEWFYAAADKKFRDARTFSLMIDLVLAHLDTHLVTIMQTQKERRSSKSPYVKMLNFLLVAWKNAAFEPYAAREQNLERGIHLLLGEGLPYDEERLYLLTNVAYCSSIAKRAFGYLCRWCKKARVKLENVLQRKASPDELRAFAPSGTDKIPGDLEVWNSAMRNEYVAISNSELKGLWRRLSLFISHEMVSSILQFLVQVPAEDLVLHSTLLKRQEYYAFVVACHKIMFSICQRDTIEEWAHCLIQLLEMETLGTHSARVDAFLHGLSILSKCVKPDWPKPFGASWKDRLQNVAHGYFRSHPKFVANLMVLCDASCCGRETLEFLCTPLSFCKNALALAGFIQSEKLEPLVEMASKYDGMKGGFKNWSHEASDDLIFALGRGKYCQLVAERGKTGCLAAGLSLCWALKKGYTVVNSTILHTILRCIILHPEKMLLPCLLAVESGQWAHSQTLVPLITFFALSTKRKTVSQAKLKLAQFRQAHPSATDERNLNLLAHKFAFAITRLPPNVLDENGVELLFIGSSSCRAIVKVMEVFVTMLDWNDDFEIDMTLERYAKSPPPSYKEALVALQAVIKRVGSRKLPCLNDAGEVRQRTVSGSMQCIDETSKFIDAKQRQQISSHPGHCIDNVREASSEAARRVDVESGEQMHEQLASDTEGKQAGDGEETLIQRGQSSGDLMKRPNPNPNPNMKRPRASCVLVEEFSPVRRVRLQSVT